MRSLTVILRVWESGTVIPFRSLTEGLKTRSDSSVQRSDGPNGSSDGRLALLSGVFPRPDGIATVPTRECSVHSETGPHNGLLPGQGVQNAANQPTGLLHERDGGQELAASRELYLMSRNGVSTTNLARLEEQLNWASLPDCDRGDQRTGLLDSTTRSKEQRTAGGPCRGANALQASLIACSARSCPGKREVGTPGAG